MKKMLIGIVAALCCLAMAAPVFAATTIGGMIQSDLFMRSFSDDRQIANGLIKDGRSNSRDTLTTTEFAMPQAFNRVFWDYKSDDKKIAGMIQLRSGGQKAVGAGTTAENNFTWEYAWIDWHLTDNFYLRVGRQTQTFAIYHSGMVLGHAIGMNALVGFGNVTGTTSRDGIRGYLKFTDNVRMEIQLLNPDTDDDFALGTGGNVQIPYNQTLINELGAGNAKEANTIPRIDLSLPIKFGSFQIEPAVTWLRQEYNQVFEGSEDKIDIWGASLGFKAGFGPFSITGEGTYGQNLGTTGSYVYLAAPTLAGSGSGGAYPNTGAAVAYQPTGANANVREIEDTENIGAWIELAFDFGPFAVVGVVGYAKDKNDGNPGLAWGTAGGDALEFDVERWAYGVRLPVKVAKNFTVTPEFTFYDFGDSEQYGPRSAQYNVDFGTAWVGGVGFTLTF